ncbi:transketolase [Desulfoluna sp.]|uniref:transketolase n=1 Tax=Desulfoluna sp. TaxID=2045199 RepID=UPI00261E4D3C|nr:transketolase [Desulfoluna sp.]
MALTDAEIGALQEQAWQLRHDIIDVTVWAGGAHIGGALSMLDILVLLYFNYLNIDADRPEMADRDRVVVSKGHGGVGIAPVLARRGYFDFDTLKSFNQFGSPFGMHLDASKVTGVDTSTGSLGHGLPMAVGLALGARAQKKTWKTYCILGDGECNEGAVWEAAMSASHFGLTNLVTFVDRNGYMIDGATEEVMSLEPFSDKWRAFGFHVLEVDGHDFAALAEAIDVSLSGEKGLCVIIAHTKKGRGIDYMEGNVKWHYGSIDSTLAEKARASVDRMYGKA